MSQRLNQSTNQPTDSRADDDDPSSVCSLFILNYFPVCFSQSTQPAPSPHLLCVPVPPVGCGVEGGSSALLPLLSRTKHDRRHVAVKALFHSFLAHPLQTLPRSQDGANQLAATLSRVLQVHAVHPLVFHRVTFMADAAPVRCPSPFNLII